jgi:hypothetical protein
MKRLLLWLWCAHHSWLYCIWAWHLTCPLKFHLILVLVTYPRLLNTRITRFMAHIRVTYIHTNKHAYTHICDIDLFKPVLAGFRVFDSRVFARTKTLPGSRQPLQAFGFFQETVLALVSFNSILCCLLCRCWQDGTKTSTASLLFASVSWDALLFLFREHTYFLHGCTRVSHVRVCCMHAVHTHMHIWPCL